MIPIEEKNTIKIGVWKVIGVQNQLSISFSAALKSNKVLKVNIKCVCGEINVALIPYYVHIISEPKKMRKEMSFINGKESFYKSNI